MVHVPSEDVDAVRRRVAHGNRFKAEVAELLAINAQLMVLQRQARPRRARPTKGATR